MSSDTPTGKTIESVAVTTSRCESPPSSVKTALPSQKKSKKSKIKAVVAATVAATQAEEEDLYNLCVDHPYVSVLYKRIRSHRKKLEKIKGLEHAQVHEGKVLNPQQLELMSNKAPLEKLVVELEMLREQFVVVYSQELEQKQQEKQPEAANGIAADGQVMTNEESEEVVGYEEEASEVKKEEEQQVVEETVEQKKVDFANVYEVLKAVHVVNLHQSLGKEVPMVLDFFSKVLLGTTRPPAELSYEENLIESLEEAKKYLLKSDKVFACDTTYGGLRAFVDQLASMSSTKPDEENVEEDVAEPGDEVGNRATVAEETLDVPVVPAEINMMPQISFFTESQLESKQSDRTAAEVKVIDLQAGVIEVAATVPQTESTYEGIEKDEVRIEEQAQMQAEVPPALDLISAPPLSFAAVAAGGSSERKPSPPASSGTTGNDKKEPGSGGNSPRGKNARRRGQGRWREKGSYSTSGGDKSGNGSPARPRRSRAPRANDETSSVHGYKRSGSKEGRRPRVDRGLQKQDHSCQPHTAPMIAPHA